MIEFGLRDEADAALAAVEEHYLDAGPFVVEEYFNNGLQFCVEQRKPPPPLDGTAFQSRSESEAKAVCALLNYRHHRANLVVRPGHRFAEASDAPD